MAEAWTHRRAIAKRAKVAQRWPHRDVEEQPYYRKNGKPIGWRQQLLRMGYKGVEVDEILERLVGGK